MFMCTQTLKRAEEEKNRKHRKLFLFIRKTKLSEILFFFRSYHLWGYIWDDLKGDEGLGEKKRISSVKIISMFSNTSSKHFVLNNLNFVLLSRKRYDRKTGYQGIRY